MKTYAITANDNKNQNWQYGSPILTCSMKTAIEMKKHLNERAKTEGYNIHWEIVMYEIKTQGINFNSIATAQPFKEPF